MYQEHGLPVMNAQLAKLRTALLLVSWLALAGCATNPVTGKREFALVSQGEEISIGQQQYMPAQQSQGGQYQGDPELTNYVQAVGDRLAAVSDTPLPYEFVVLNNSTPNAWALPGGKIAINRGLLVTLENEAELAAVLGHEIVHAAARHGAKSMERAMLLQGAAVLTAIGVSGSDYGNYIMEGAQLGSQLITTQYGRGAELESDYYGMQYMARAGYDPAAAISLQEKFVQLSQGRSSSWLDGLFASHPPSQQRVEKNRETAAQIKSAQAQDWKLGQATYQSKIGYLKSKTDAYQALDQATTLARKNELSAAYNRLDRAISLEPRESRFYGFKGNLLFNEKKYQDAVAEFDRAIQLDNGYYEFFLGRGMSHSALGNQSQAKQDLMRSNQLLPTAIATHELGHLSLAAGDRATAKRYYADVAQSGGNLGQSAANSYIRLDLSDNPARYFNVSAEVNQGQVIARIVNRTSLAIRSGVLSYSAVINGQPRQGQAHLGAISAGQGIRVSIGWRISDADFVDRLNFQVIDVSL